MGTLQIPDYFQKSYLDFMSYPCNLVYRTPGTALKLYKARLDFAELDLCEVDERLVEVPIRDSHNDSGKEENKYNIHTFNELTQWLGVETTIDPADPNKQIVSAKCKDPKCRFIYIYGEHSRDRLKITQNMLTQILTYHQVMPAYLDFISVFGAQSEPHDLRFSSFREQTTLTDPPRSRAVPGLGRSGRQYQLCYNLKCVALKSEDKTKFMLNEWSIQQAVIHHQFDIVEGRMLWIITKGSLDFQECSKELTGKDANPEDRAFNTFEECFRSSLSAHLLYCHWSTEYWLRYIKWLERVVENENVIAIPGPRGIGYAYKKYQPQNIQDLQRWEDKTNECIMVLEANVNVMASLRRFYDGLKDDKNFPLRSSCADDIVTFAAEVDDIIHNFKMRIARARVLTKITNDRKQMILLHLQSQATEHMEKLDHNMGREAIVTRTITLTTLLYIPGILVSTIISTDIIKYQNQNGDKSGNGNFSRIDMSRWLQVTLPLTFLTLLIAWVVNKWAQRRRETDEQPQKVNKVADIKQSQPPTLPMYHQMRDRLLWN